MWLTPGEGIFRLCGGRRGIRSPGPFSDSLVANQLKLGLVGSLSLVCRPKVLVEPVQRLFDQFVMRNTVSGLVRQFLFLVLFGAQ
jgi:hypothetical protein